VVMPINSKKISDPVRKQSRAGRHLCREAGLAGALLVLPRRRVDVGPAEARGLRHDTNSRFCRGSKKEKEKSSCVMLPRRCRGAGGWSSCRGRGAAPA
jgi:hypothetical protein